jgi:hypothetical protein
MIFRHSFLCLSISAAIPLCAVAADSQSPVTMGTDEVEFNDQFLFNTGSKVDVSRFSHGNPVLPGKYRTKINVNGKPKMTSDVEFKDNGTPRATPCFTVLALKQMGINTESLEKTPDITDETCIAIEKAFQEQQQHLILRPRSWISRSHSCMSLNCQRDMSILHCGTVVFLRRCSPTISTPGEVKALAAQRILPMQAYATA